MTRLTWLALYKCHYCRRPMSFVEVSPHDPAHDQYLFLWRDCARASVVTLASTNGEER